MDSYPDTFEVELERKVQTQQHSREPAGFMQIQIVGQLRDVETIAAGHGIRELARLKKQYGPGRWRKRKGFATVVLRGRVVEAELHWYEAHGIGKQEMRLIRILE